MNIFKGVLLLLWLTAQTALPAHADVTPPYGGLFQSSDDRFLTDQFCFGKPDGAACQIPGHVFDGAGAGVCRQIRDKYRYSHRLFITTCHPDQSVLRIDRGFPASAFSVSYYRPCDEDEPDPAITSRFPGKVFTCGEAPRVVDRFCRGKQVDDACEASMRVNGRLEKRAGQCRENLEDLFIDDKRVADRPVLQCEPAKEINRDYTRVGPPGETHWLCSLWENTPGCVLGWHRGLWSFVQAFFADGVQSMALFLTLLMEVPVILFFARRWGLSGKRAFWAGVAMSSITHPIAWEAADVFYTETGWLLVWGLIEASVVVVEAMLMRWWLRVTWRRAALLSMLANGFTALVGLLA